jgi:hypothetical protein
MTDSRFYLSEIFSLAFGVKSPVFVPYTIDLDRFLQKEGSNYNPNAATPASSSATFPDVKVKLENEAEAMSWMGTPIVYPFTLQGGSYKKFKASGELEKVQMADFMMPAATLVDFTRAKAITKTPVLGSNGTVKELYSFEDWRIRVRGVCLNDSSRQMAKTAVEQKQQLLQWEQIAGSINVLGSLFLEKQIFAITINSASFTQLEGKSDVIPFEFECESDERLELIL